MHAERAYGFNLRPYERSEPRLFAAGVHVAQQKDMRGARSPGARRATSAGDEALEHGVTLVADEKLPCGAGQGHRRLQVRRSRVADMMRFLAVILARDRARLTSFASGASGARKVQSRA
jgi:hypothetical protein